MIFRQLFDRETCTYTYLLGDEKSKQALLIDPVKEQVERDLRLIAELGLTLKYTLETHVHADHVTASGLLREKVGSQSVFSSDSGNQCADILLQHGEVLEMGSVRLEGRHTPGHTNGCITFVEHKKALAFTGDTLFVRGCGRTDFQQGSAEDLYQSVHEQIYSLPLETKVYPGHDYKGRTMSTVKEEMEFNPRLQKTTSLQDFVEIMNNLNLAYPAKIKEALPANMNCGLSSKETWAPLSNPNSIPEVSVNWTKRNIETGSFQLVDCREDMEWNQGHIPGAKHIPLRQVNVRIQELDKDRPVIVYCRSGNRSLKATQVLQNQGFKVASMTGGIMSY
jgi:glyoxylase-like metal-dependent hydrolase (beta-lactamase superfamily II)/rhodanese-related sulfurtransferase